jgi:hypothetical protein
LWGKSGETYGKPSGDGIKADVDLVHEVGRVADAHERTALVNVVLPSVELVVALEREPYPLVLALDEEAVRFEIGAFDVRDVPELDKALDGGGLFRSPVSRESSVAEKNNKKIRD